MYFCLILWYNVDTDVSTYKNASHFPLEGFNWLVRVDLWYNVTKTLYQRSFSAHPPVGS